MTNCYYCKKTLTKENQFNQNVCNSCSEFNETLKECNICLNKKPLNDFYRSFYMKNGFFNNCKKCTIYKNTGKQQKFKVENKDELYREFIENLIIKENNCLVKSLELFNLYKEFLDNKNIKKSKLTFKIFVSDLSDEKFLGNPIKNIWIGYKIKNDF
jgi:DNA mismatch repair ATPase MutS